MATNNHTLNNLGSIICCGICLRPVRVGEGDSSAAVVEHGGSWYHAACANLWVNRVELTLPSLTVGERRES